MPGGEPKRASIAAGCTVRLRRLARQGCSRLVDPSTCRKPNGYPEAEWCEGCIAAEGLGLPVEWFVLKP